MTASRALDISDTGQALQVTVGDVEICRYVYDSAVAQVESPRPYLHPVRRLDGALVSLYRPHDHVWHKGISLALPNVGPENFWGGPTFVRGKGYVSLPNNGTQQHKEFAAVEVRDGVGQVEERLTWVTQDGAAWLDEQRTLQMSVLPEDDAWMLGFRTSLTNIRGEPIEFGSPTTEGRHNAGYAGLFCRGPRSFNKGTILASDAQGGPEMMGRRARWLAYVGKHDEIDGTSTIVFVDKPDNIRYPTKWFVRDDPYACVCPAPFFDEVYELAAEATLTLTYSVVIAAGSWDAERIERLVAS